jgi:hypothetical protein
MSRLDAVLLAATVLAALAVEGAAEGADAGRREKPLALPAIDATGLVAVPLDADVHAAAADGYGDLRILDAAGGEVPYVVRDVTRTDRRPVRRTDRAVRPDAKPLADDGLEITVVPGPGQDRVVPEGFTLLTPLRDFEHRVTVSWSADGREWTPVVADAVVYDYTRFMDVRDVTIPLPAAPARGPGGRYRIVIGDVTQEQQSRLTELTRTLAGGAEREVRERTVLDRRPFRIDGIEFWYTEEVEQQAAAVLQDRALGGFRVAREPDGRGTRITVDARRQPVTEFTIATDTKNFSRAVTVERPLETDRDGRRDRGRPIATATITRIDVAGIRREQLAIPVPESRLETYDLVIDDGDSPPLAVTGVAARGPAREAVFLAEPGGAYRIAYGGDRAAPRYDTAAIRAALAARALPTPATAGAESVVAAPPPAADPLWLLGDGRFQVALIAVLAAILAAALFRAAKRIDAAPPTRE